MKSAQIYEWAEAINRDGTPSQVGPTYGEMHNLGRIVAALESALAECIDANDELHNALCNDSKSEPRHHEIFVAAQRRETAAIEKARALLKALEIP